MKRLYLLGLMIALLASQAALAQTFSVKGVLRDPLGRTVEDGAYKLTLRLYTQATGGSEFWTEVHGSAQAQHGVVSVELGSVESLASVGFGQTYWLGIQVEDHAEMEPRIKLGTNPYSLAVKGKDHVFPSTGNVGVNTLAPTEPLEVNGNAKVTGALIFGDGSSMSSADLGGTASSLLNPSTALVTADSDADGSGQIEFKTGTSTDLVIQNDGNVFIPNRLGIGTSTPGSNLSIEGIGSAIELGAGVPDKQGDAGKIMFRTHSDALDITGAGSNQERRLKLWAEQGTHITGNLRVGAGDFAASGMALSVAPGLTQFDSPFVFGGAMTINGNNSSVGIAGATDPQVNLAIGDHDTGLQQDGDGRLAVYTNGVERLHMDELGNVNIGRLGFGAVGIWGLGSYIVVGQGVADKQTNAGEIGFRRHSDALDIVGGGSNQTRRIKFWAEHDATFTGRVGIGTDLPAKGLHITHINTNGIPGAGISLAGGVLNTNASIELVNDFGGTPHIDFSNSAADDFDARFILADNDNLWLDGADLTAIVKSPSDLRIKNVLGQSDGARDLASLRAIEVVDYTYVDTASMGADTHKKLIAQQVREIYPRAVSENANFLPSVYQMSTATARDAQSGLLTIKTDVEHGFAVGDTVRLRFGMSLEEKAVQQVADAHTFAVEHAESAEQVFVYGKKVHDFLTVDYQAVAMLNVSATQELARRVETLERDNAALQAELRRYQALEAENAMLKVRMERFEAVLQRLEGQQEQRVDDAVVKTGELSLAD